MFYFVNVHAERQDLEFCEKELRNQSSTIGCVVVVQPFRRL